MGPRVCRRRFVVAVASILVVPACATTVTPPAAVTEPATVALLDHGRHSSLMIALTDDAMVRYAYGEWRWYAEGSTGPARAVAALFLPTEAALGRKILPGPLTPETAHERVRERFEAAFLFEVEAARAAQLVRRLDALFERGAARRLHHPGWDLDFVPVPASYWLGRNSNQVTGEWLLELGCRVDGGGLLSVWRVEKR